MRILCAVIGFFIAGIVAATYGCIRYFLISHPADPMVAELRFQQLNIDCTGIMLLLGSALSGLLLRLTGNHKDAAELSIQTRQFKPVGSFIGAVAILWSRWEGMQQGIPVGILDLFLIAIAFVGLVIASMQVWQLGKLSAELDRSQANE